MATTTTAFEAELLAGGFTLEDRGLQAGAAYKLRRAYLDGQTDPGAHNVATVGKTHGRVSLVKNNKKSSFDAITGP